MTEQLETAIKAVQLYAETHPRPTHVNQGQAAGRQGPADDDAPGKRIARQQMLADADRGADEPKNQRQLDLVLPFAYGAQVADDPFRHLLFLSPVFAGDALKPYVSAITRTMFVPSERTTACFSVATVMPVPLAPMKRRLWPVPL